MLRLSLRNLVANKLRLLLTVMAVTLGTAFVAGTFVLSDTMVKAFDELYSDLSEGTDVVVRAESPYQADPTTTMGQLKPLDEEVVATVRAVPGVAAAEGSVAGFALVIDPEGRPVQPNAAPTLGVSMWEDPRLTSSGTMRSGRLPAGPQEAVIDARTVSSAGFRLGDRVHVVLEGGRETFTLVGVVGFGETDSLLGATLVGFDLRTAQRVLGKPGVVDEVAVAGAGGTDATELRDRIAAVLPAGVTALTGSQAAEEDTDAVADTLGIFTTVLLVFAGVSLLVGSFVIWNTFSVLVAQRRREVALLRAVGGTRRQVLGGVMLEAGTIGLVSGVLGLGVGVGLAVGIRWILGLVGVDIPSTSPAVEPRTVLAAVGVGLVVTTVAAVLPAWVATRVAPMEALRDTPPVSTTSGRLRHLAGWSVMAAGAVGLLVTSLAGNERWWTVAAAGTAFAGLVFVGPTLARGLARLAGHGRRGGAWQMAARSIGRNSRRAAATALGLSIGLAVVVAVAVTAASLKESVTAAVAEGNRSDLILEPAGAGIGISSSIAAALRDRPDVAEVVELREWGAQVAGGDTLVTGMDTRGLDEVIDLGVETGSLDDLTRGSVLVSSTQARRLGVGKGESLSIVFPETGAQDFRVAGTFSKGSLINASFIVPMPDYEANVTSRLDGAILLTAAPGVDAGTLESTLERALADYPNVSVATPSDITEEAQRSVDDLLGIVTALLLLAVVVAVLGIVNTLALSVVERTRELGLLRAVGATRHQVSAVVRRESLLMALLGALAGEVLGVAAGVALARALLDEGITTISVPTTTLVVYLLVAVAVGVLAAVGPARRASRVDVLTSLAAE